MRAALGAGERAHKWRPHGDIRAFMDKIPATPFRDALAFPFVAALEERYEDIQVLCVTHAHACMHAFVALVRAHIHTHAQTHTHINICVSGGVRGAPGEGHGAVSVSGVDEL